MAGSTSSRQILYKNVGLQILWHPQENTCEGVSLKLNDTSLKKISQIIFCEFHKRFQNIYFVGHIWTTSSVYLTNLVPDSFKLFSNISEMLWTPYRDIFEELQSGVKTLGLKLSRCTGPGDEWVKSFNPLTPAVNKKVVHIYGLLRDTKRWRVKTSYIQFQFNYAQTLTYVPEKQGGHVSHSSFS